MARKRTGLRNRYRSGQSTYATKHKSSKRDLYGTYNSGKQSSPELVAGKSLGELPYYAQKA